MCISGDGRILPSFVIYKKTLPPRDIEQQMPPKWVFTSSQTGKDIILKRVTILNKY